MEAKGWEETARKLLQCDIYTKTTFNLMKSGFNQIQVFLTRMQVLTSYNFVFA